MTFVLEGLLKLSLIVLSCAVLLKITPVSICMELLHLYSGAVIHTPTGISAPVISVRRQIQPLLLIPNEVWLEYAHVFML